MNQVINDNHDADLIQEVGFKKKKAHREKTSQWSKYTFLLLERKILGWGCDICLI